MMTDNLKNKCTEHSSPFECPDSLIFYSDVFNEYGLIVHDGGNSWVEIKYCPWCSKKLPKSRRNQWFETLEELGFDDPWEQKIPEAFKSGKWYKEKTGKGKRK